MSAGTAGWRVWADTGGTFTDCLAVGPDGALRRAKVLSSSALRATVDEVLGPRRLRLREDWGASADPLRGGVLRLLPGGGEARVERYDVASGECRLAQPLPGAAAGAAVEIRSPDEAPVLAARLVTGTPAGRPLPPMEMRLATTRGTNALLERRGAPTALWLTRGHRDLLEIGTQQRPELFALRVEKPRPLYTEVVEVDERLAADGSVLRALDESALRPAAERLLEQGVRVAAVALLHSFRNPEHEHRLRDLLLECGFEAVSCSADLAPFQKILPRAETALVDAYLRPVVGGYLDRVRGALGEGRLHVMTSAGGLVGPDAFRPKDSLLSGPAGGVVGAALAGRRAGRERVIAFDMGGTSTDVARYDGRHEYVWEHEVGGARLLAPALAIESVAAGGGSVCTLDAQGLRVGPESAGASPGPACYGAGGPLAVTDVNLLLGRLDPERFGIPVSTAPAEAALDRLRAELRERRGQEIGREPLLAGFLEIANERMADAIREISLRRGYDVAEYALVAFGGAGGQHACGVADRLGVETAIVPPDAGLLSALGIGHAPLERFAERQVLRPLDAAGQELAGLLDALADEAVAAVAAEGVPAAQVHVRRRIVNLRYHGQETALAVEHDPAVPLRTLFEQRYQAVYGHRPDPRPIELESVRVVASTDAPAADPTAAAEPYRPEPRGHRRAWMGGAWREVPLFHRPELRPGARVPGPALVLERHSATVVEPGWGAEVDGSGAVVMRRQRTAGGDQEAGVARGAAGPGQVTAAREGERPGAEGPGPFPSPVEEELFTHRFTSLVREMGEQLRRTALSTNVKERLDFSCALLDTHGELVVNAPHIPVHLGALGLCVRRVREAVQMGEGDVVVTNHPGYGGSHLPDVTTVAPVHLDGRLLGYVATRAHHAEIGGTRPGSMPPAARSLAEEGVVIEPMHLLRGGEPRWAAVRAVLGGGPHPSRAVEDNLADLRAAVAAGHRGAELLRGLARQHGADTVAHHMRALTGRAETRIRQALAALPDGERVAEERLDDGSALRVAFTVRGDRATVDFAGSASVHPGNLNATPAIVRSVVLYVLRLLIDEPLPLNEGLLRPVELRIPEGLLNPAFPPDPAAAPAVVGGNTEVSQRLTDTLLKALGLVACGQGTMNNLLWGTDRFGYYETVCGGCGAGPGWAGASAVHWHMTNTRITDVEVVEHRYPVRVERFAVRRGSGGAGRWPGGDGVLRELLFLEPMSVSVLTQHRVERPYGMQGGQPGAPGRQTLLRTDGTEQRLRPVDGVEVDAGDRLLLETPGGGGWGPG